MVSQTETLQSIRTRTTKASVPTGVLNSASLAQLNRQNDARPPRSIRQSSQRRSKPDNVSVGTRDDEQLRNVDDFIEKNIVASNDLLSKQEDQLQREIAKMNRGNLHKHAQVVKQNKINTRIQSTEQLVKRMLNVPEPRDARQQ